MIPSPNMRGKNIVYFLIALFCLSVASDVNAGTQGSIALTATGTISAISPFSVNTGGSYVTFALLQGTTTKMLASNSDLCLGSSLSGSGIFSATSTWLGVNLFTSLGLGYGSNPAYANCTTAGYYYLMVSAGLSGSYYPSYYYWKVYYNGTDVTPTNPTDPQGGYEINFSTQYETRFTNLEYSTTSTTSVNFAVSYFIEPTEATTTQADKNPTMIRVRYSKQPAQTYDGLSLQIEDAVSPTWGTGTTTFDLNLDASSTYDVIINFANAGSAVTGIVPFPLAYVYFTVETDASGGISTTTAPEFYNAQQEQAFEYQPCGITELGGCIINALQFTFMPSDESVDRFMEINDALQVRTPFIYVYQIPDYWEMLYTSSTTQTLTVSASTTAFGTITFISEAQLDAIPLTNQVRTILGYLLWVATAFTLYRMAVSIFDHDNKTAT